MGYYVLLFLMSGGSGSKGGIPGSRGRIILGLCIRLAGTVGRGGKGLLNLRGLGTLGPNLRLGPFMPGRGRNCDLALNFLGGRFSRLLGMMIISS